MDKLVSQKVLANQYGMTSRAFGDTLRTVGLKDGGDASQKAIDAGLVGELGEGHYSSYRMWDEGKVQKFLKDKLDLDLISNDEKKDHLSAEKCKAVWMKIAQLIRTDERHSNAQASFPKGLQGKGVSIDSVMRILPKMSYFRNVDLCYDMVSYLYYMMKSQSKGEPDVELNRLSELCVEIFEVTLDEILSKSK